MPAFPSFISLPRRNKNKNTKSPFDVRRRNTPTSPHPYAAPAVFDISHDKRASMDSTVSTISEGTEKRLRRPGEPEQPLGVKLDINLSPEPITNWFPEHLFPGGEGGASGSGSGLRGRSVKQLQNSHKDSAIDQDGGMYGDSEDEETSSMSDDILANLEALDASHFVNFVGSATNKSNRVNCNCTYPHQNSGGNFAWCESPARTLGFRFGSSVAAHFSDLISRRVICRLRLYLGASIDGEDSATLPRGEHPFLNSPVIRDRTLSWGSQFSSSLSPASSEPVPPIPFNAELVYSPPKNPRLETNKTIDAPKRASIGSITRVSGDMDPHPSTSLPHSNSMTSAALSDHYYSEPLEKINETSPVDFKEFQDIPLLASNAAHATPPIKTNSDHNASPSCSNVQHPVTPSTDISVTSGKDIGDVLDYYEYSSSNEPAAESDEYRLPFSPIPEELSSQLSPPSPFKQDARPHPGGLILSTSAPSASGSGRIEWVARRDSVRSANSSLEDNGNRLSLLPIGERPRSLQRACIRVQVLPIRSLLTLTRWCPQHPEM
ncbi:hypothetical protein DFS33DRAFT_761369 [Desarmillaria ectypa]|nr:hypothetical protein DFS33DRAFT_761369 [Desarmillaria ectypa]